MDRIRELGQVITDWAFVERMTMTFNTFKEIHIQLQVSYPIQIISILSTLSTIIIVILVVYVIRRDKTRSGNPVTQVVIPSNFEELFLLIKDWEFEKYKTLLSNFLLTDEYTILNLLLISMQEDDLSIIDEGRELRISGDGGWRNKHQISEATGLSSRKVYDKNGIVERLTNLGFLEIRDKDGWGRQTAQYRANIDHALVKSMFAALLRSLT